MKKQGFIARFRQYLLERFPLHKNGVLLAVLYTAMYLVSAAVTAARFNGLKFSAGLLVFILFFLQLRLMDEFKDFKDDSRYRPKRPVPRGLITLRELKPVLAFVIAAELTGGYITGVTGFVFIVSAIAYSVLMFYEFFIGKTLKKHIYAYALSHGVISFPAAYFAASAASGEAVKDVRLLYAAVIVFLTSFAFEIARKVRRPGEEQKGVETYTKASGEETPVFILVFLAAALLAAGLALVSGMGAAVPYLVKFIAGLNLYYALISALYVAGCMAYAAKKISVKKGGFIENITGVYIVLYYAVLIAAGLPALFT